MATPLFIYILSVAATTVTMSNGMHHQFGCKGIHHPAQHDIEKLLRPGTGIKEPESDIQ